MSKENPANSNRSKSENASESDQLQQFSSAKSKFLESEERFKLLISSVADYAIFLMDPKGFVQSWNTGAQRIKGYSAEEIIGKNFSLFYTPEDLKRHHPEHELEIAEKEGRYEEEGWRVRKDGSRFWANIVITRLASPQGEAIGFAKVTRDLTARKAAEEELRQSEERYRLLVSAVKDYAIFLLDPEGRVATWNEGAQRLKGYAASEIIGQHFSKFYPEEGIRDKRPEKELKEATETGRFEEEDWRVRKDGSRFWANVVLTAVRDSKGKLIGFSKVTRDMTDRKRLEERLRGANEELDKRVQERTAQLEQAVRARDEFISIVSHELRTPLTSLKLQVQMANRQLDRNNMEEFNTRAVKFVHGAGRQLDRLSRLIDDMLDVSRISMDRLPLEMRPVNLNEVVRENVERFELETKGAGSSLEFHDEEPVEILGDRHRLEQVLSNLLVNAVKYGDSKPIKVSLRRNGQSAVIDIQDQGIGIAPEDMERIFERFERAVTPSEVSGMGLGLYITRKIVEAHHGKISVRSELGKGSVFTVRLPAL